MLQAVDNVRQYYTIVGVIEDLHSFVERLENYYPAMFSGLVKSLNDNGKYIDKKTQHNDYTRVVHNNRNILTCHCKMKNITTVAIVDHSNLRPLIHMQLSVLVRQHIMQFN